ncbi:MAG: hypothetical protein J2P24_03150 [Streptosporangiales bacterium]|nr:hypothetical protein [Streptosporangiales bacterium]MBO0890836.1 hypothetical protein [Acidothermales bacterium]
MTLVRTGHFVFESGDHGDTWLALDELVSNPGELRREAEDLAGRLGGYDADLVCGPLEGGAFVAQWVAALLGARFTYSRRERRRRYVTPAEVPVLGARVALVDDAVNVGSATIATAHELSGRGAEVVVLASLLACLPNGPRVGARLGVPQVYLTAVDSKLWPAGDCLLCRAGVPIGAY